MTRFIRSEHCWEAAADGQMTPAMAEHLDQCAACAERLARVEAARGRTLAAIPLPRPGLDERLMAALEELKGARPRRRPPRRAAGLPRLLAPGLALAVAVVALALVLRPAVRTESAHAVPISPLQASCAPTGKDGRLLVAGVWSGAEARRFASVLERFERHSGIEVAYAYETREIAAKLEARIDAGCAPDVAILPQPGLMTDLVRRGRIGPVDDVVGDLVARNYSRPWRHLATVDGRLYGVWFKAADKSTVWYDRSAFRAAGIPRAPRTWDELIAAARRLHASGIRPFAIAGADGWTLTDWFENVYLRSAGPALYDALAEHRIPWTHPSVKQALRRLSEVFADEGLIGPASQARRTSFEQAVADVFGRPGRAAIFHEGDFVRSYLPRGLSAHRAGLFRFPGPAPAARSQAVVGGDVAVMLSRTGPARELMRFLATPAAAEPWVAAGGFLSPNLGVDPARYPDALGRRAAAAITRAQTVRFDLSDLQPPAFGARAEQGMWELFQDLLAHPGDVDLIARRLEIAALAAHRCERATGGPC